MGGKPAVPDRRSQSRAPLAVPVRVTGHDAHGNAWHEMAMTVNADFAGAALTLRRPVIRGHVLHLLLPLPKRFRSYDLTAASYSVFAVVRNTVPLPDGTQRVGVMFLGRHPPREHAENPGGLYLLSTDSTPEAGEARAHAGPERRAHPRYDLAIPLKLTRPQPVPFGPPWEQTTTRNLSAGGAMALTSLPLDKQEIVLVEDLQGILRTRAEVRGLFIGKDNVPRLNLRFLDEGVEEAVRALFRQNGIFE